MPKNQQSSLGKALQNQQKKKFQDKIARVQQPGQFMHNEKPAEDEYQIQQRNLQSIIDQDTLNEYLCLADLANKKYDTQKGEIVQKKTREVKINVVSQMQVDNIYDPERNKLIKDLRIPRRPDWNSKMSVVELRQKENDAFLAWRRQLAAWEEKNYTTALTPFEKNIEVWKQLWRVVEKSDILVQVVDGRDILFFRCEDLEKYVVETHVYDQKQTKQNFLLINKSDLMNEDVRKAWSEYLRSQNVQHMFFSAKIEQETQEQARAKLDNLIPFEAPVQETSVINTPFIADTHCLLAELKKLVIALKKERVQIIEETKEAPQHDFKNIVIGMVGYPNVGKSSVINTLCNRKLVGVASRPGKTKHFQTIQLEEDILLCDCPGLVFPNAASSRGEMVCNGILPIDNMKDYLSPIDVLVQRIPKIVFEKIYGLSLKEQKELSSPYLLQSYSIKRGFVTGNALPDEFKAARIILKEFIKGRLLYVKPPPGAPKDLWTSNNLEDLEQQLEKAQEEETRILEELVVKQDYQPPVKLSNQDLMEIFSQEDLLELMEGKKVHGVKLTKEQRREIKFAFGRGEQIDLKKYLVSQKMLNDDLYKTNIKGQKIKY